MVPLEHRHKNYDYLMLVPQLEDDYKKIKPKQFLNY